FRERRRALGGGLGGAPGGAGERQAGVVNGAFLANAGDDVGARPALGRVIEPVVDGDERGPDARAELLEPAEPARLVAAIAVHAGGKGPARRRAPAGREPARER